MVQVPAPHAPTETDLPQGWAHPRSAPRLPLQMDPDLWYDMARHRNSLPPLSLVVVVAVAVVIHAHIEAGNMEAWL